MYLLLNKLEFQLRQNVIKYLRWTSQLTIFPHMMVKFHSLTGKELPSRETFFQFDTL
jgi:hypothetical protein